MTIRYNWLSTRMENLNEPAIQKSYLESSIMLRTA